MSNGVGLPPDIAAQQNKQTRGGIGGSATENSANATQRVAAMDPRAPLKKEELPPEEAPKESVEVAKDVCPATLCGAEVEENWNFCPICKTDLLHGSAAKRIGIELGEGDLSDYLFKGYITRDVKVLGKYSITLKTSQPSDLEEIDAYIMNGKWGKNEDGTDRKISDFYMRQMNAMCMTAAAMVMFNGEPVGDSLDKRVDWLRARGASLVDILSQRVSLFNQSIAEFLQKEDTVLKS